MERGRRVKALPATLPPLMEAGSLDSKELTGTKKQQQRKSGRVWGDREASKGRVAGGSSQWGRDQEIVEGLGGCKRHPALTSAAGAATVTREGRGTSWDCPGRAPQSGVQRLIT